MTRSGKSPRLGAHSPEPTVEIHPDDAAATGITDGGFAKVTTAHGSAVFRGCIRPGQQRGSIFAPIHWSYSTAADAYVGALAMAENDPFSGQPELKATPARVEPLEFAYRGFALTRDLIALPGRNVVRARRRCRGSRTSVRDQRIAGAMAWSGRTADIWRRRSVPSISICRVASCASPRCAPAGSRPAFSPDRHKIRRDGRSCARCSVREFWPSAIGVFFFPATAPRAWPRPGRSSAPVTVSDWKPSAALWLKGVAANVADIGRTLRAGTNCGSCVPELRGIIERTAPALARETPVTPRRAS